MEAIMADPGKKMLWAAENGNTQLVTELIQTDSSLVHSKDSDGYSPLHRAAYENHPGIDPHSLFPHLLLLNSILSTERMKETFEPRHRGVALALTTVVESSEPLFW